MSIILDDFELSLVCEQENGIADYYSHLLCGNLSVPKAKKIAAIAHSFSVQYHAYHYLQGCDRADGARFQDYVENWYFEKNAQPSLNELKSWIGILHSFFEYLQELDKIPGDRLNQLLSVGINSYTYQQCLNRHKYRSEKQLPPLRAKSDWQYLLCSEEEEFHAGQDSVLTPRRAAPLSLSELLKRWQHLQRPNPQIRNLILWNPASAEIELTFDSQDGVISHAMQILCHNRAFIRCLQRHHIREMEIPETLFLFLTEADAWLEKVIAVVDKRGITLNEIEEIRRIYAALERALRETRSLILQEVGLPVSCLQLLYGS